MNQIFLCNCKAQILNLVKNKRVSSLLKLMHKDMFQDKGKNIKLYTRRIMKKVWSRSKEPIKESLKLNHKCL